MPVIGDGWVGIGDLSPDCLLAIEINDRLGGPAALDQKSPSLRRLSARSVWSCMHAGLGVGRFLLDCQRVTVRLQRPGLIARLGQHESRSVDKPLSAPPEPLRQRCRLSRPPSPGCRASSPDARAAIQVAGRSLQPTCRPSDSAPLRDSSANPTPGSTTTTDARPGPCDALPAPRSGRRSSVSEYPSSSNAFPSAVRNS